MIKRIKRKIHRFSSLLDERYKDNMMMVDMKSHQNLLPLLINKPFLPVNQYALRPYAINFACNEIIINKRRSIIELGSGISTILIGRLIAQHNLDTMIYSVDSSEAWIENLSSIIGSELKSVAENIRFIHAPIKDGWYDVDSVSVLKEMHFDFLIIDGPVNDGGKTDIRHMALSYLHDNLSESCVVLLDDVLREGEKHVLKRWNAEYSFNFEIYNKSIAVAYRGHHWVADPSKGYYDTVFV